MTTPSDVTVTTSTPVVTGILEHLFSEQEVMVTTVVEDATMVSVCALPVMAGLPELDSVSGQYVVYSVTIPDLVVVTVVNPVVTSPVEQIPAKHDVVVMTVVDTVDSVDVTAEVPPVATLEDTEVIAVEAPEPASDEDETSSIVIVLSNL